jgi:CRP-like cAMP-binding protein
MPPLALVWCLILLETPPSRYLRVQNNAPGDVLFNQYDTSGDTFYIIIRGSVIGTVEGSDEPFTLKVGDSFGDMALSADTAEDRVRTATIVCDEDAMFATLSRVDFLRVSGSLHATAVRVLKEQMPKTRTDADIGVLQG